MTFKEWWVNTSREQKLELEKVSGLERVRLSQIAHGHIRPGINTLLRILKAVNAIDKKVKLKATDVIEELKV